MDLHRGEKAAFERVLQELLSFQDGKSSQGEEEARPKFALVLKELIESREKTLTERIKQQQLKDENDHQKTLIKQMQKELFEQRREFTSHIEQERRETLQHMERRELRLDKDRQEERVLFVSKIFEVVDRQRDENPSFYSSGSGIDSTPTTQMSEKNKQTMSQDKTPPQLQQDEQVNSVISKLMQQQEEMHRQQQLRLQQLQQQQQRPPNSGS